MLISPVQKEEGEIAGWVEALRARISDALQLVPRRWIRPFDQPDVYLELLFLPDEVVISRVRHRKSDEFFRIPRGDPLADGPDQMPPLRKISAFSEYPKGVSILLPQADCLHRTIEMPDVRRSALRAALAFELERISPIDPQQVYFDFDVLSKNRGAGKVMLDLRIVKRETIDRVLSWCHNAGLRVGSIGFQDDSRGASWTAFPVDKDGVPLLLWTRWSIPVLACSAVLLAGFILLSAYQRGNETLAGIRDQIQIESTNAEISSNLREELRLVTSQASYLLVQKRAPTIINAISELTKILPDTAWLTGIQIVGHHMRVQGYSKSASDLIGIVERSGTFSNAQFAAPLMKANDTDRFDISFEIRRGAR